MKELDECLAKTRKIKEINEDIAELRDRAFSPKNQIITGMPRGGAGGNQSDSYIVKLERLEDRQERLIHERDSLWDGIYEALTSKNIKAEHITLLRHRFYSGLQWPKCCKLMCEEYPGNKWNMNKVFRVYRQILKKFAID